MILIRRGGGRRKERGGPWPWQCQPAGRCLSHGTDDEGLGNRIGTLKGHAAKSLADHTPLAIFNDLSDINAELIEFALTEDPFADF